MIYFNSTNFDRPAPHFGQFPGGQSGNSPEQVQPQTLQRHLAIYINF
jgi:hypothetical protein